jgi:large subunit ribosomal protein L35
VIGKNFDRDEQDSRVRCRVFHLAHAFGETRFSPGNTPCSDFANPYSSRSFENRIESMRRPRGNKTRKAVAKRFKISAGGKVLRSRAGRRHLLSAKSPKLRRNLGKAAAVDATDTYRIVQNLPFSH